jgi:inner membrane protein
MTARTHDLFAFASLTTAAIFFPPPSLNIGTVFVSIIACDVGSLIPDMDQSGNRLWDLLPGGNFVGKIGRRIFLGHRSLSHSFIGTYLLYKLLSWGLPLLLNQLYIDSRVVLASVMIGFISHLVSDGLTEEGVPLLFPLKLKFGFPPVSSWRIRTGGWFESLVVFPGILVYLFLLVKNNQHLLIDLFKKL